MLIFLEVPFLSAQAAATAARARRLRCPVWLAGGPGSGAYSVARALHREGDARGFVSVRLPLASAAEIEQRITSLLAADPSLEELSLYVERIDRQPAAAQEAVLRSIDEGARWNGVAIPVRVIAQTDRDPSGGVSLLAELRRRLTALVVPLPPLSERRSDVPAIARVLAGEIARRIGRPAPSLSEQFGALADWPGTVEDLEAALTRALAASTKTTLSAADLGLVPAPAPAAERTAVEPSTAPDTSAEQPYRLESLITELAHEFKNPMVTIKTFAQHMDHLFSDAELRDKFARLTAEAIERMDGFLDELTQFSRFSAPRPRRVSLADLVARSLELADSAGGERVRANGIPRGVEAQVDEEQIIFALRAVVRALTRELPADARIVLSLSGPNELVFQAKVEGPTRKLPSVLYPEDGAAQTSLHFTLADMLLRRNGGTCRVVRSEASLEAHLVLPVLDA